MARSLLFAAFLGAVLVMQSPAQPPAWAVGTFRTTDPSSGSVAELTITANGAVTSISGEDVLTGALRGERIRLGDSVWRIRRIPNGIRATKPGGEVIDYLRVSAAGAPSGRPIEWAVGSFSGPNPVDGSRIILTIESDGKVTAMISGNAFYGTLNGEMLNMNGAVARVTRSEDGIVTTRVDNGESITYSRTGGTVTGRPERPPQGNVPSWAVGTFWSVDAATKAEVSIAIAPDGNVTLNMGRGNILRGSMYEDRITIGDATYDVSRVRNGIRTVNTDSGARAEYFLR